MSILKQITALTPYILYRFQLQVTGQSNGRRRISGMRDTSCARTTSSPGPFEERGEGQRMPQSRTQSMPVRRLGAGHDSGETEYRISNFGYPVSYAHAHAQTATLNSRGRH